MNDQVTGDADIEAELLFTEMRLFSPQWEVTFRGEPVARVTERYVARPLYVVSWPDGTEISAEDAYDVVRAIVARVRGSGAAR